MAILLQTEYRGVTANYWKIISCNMDYLNALTSVTLGIYYTKEARDADKTAYLSTQTISLAGIDLTRPEIYVMLKLLPQFINSENI